MIGVNPDREEEGKKVMGELSGMVMTQVNSEG